MAYRERTGLLLIADISGYTEYLRHTELAHAQSIVSRLLEAAISGARSLEVVKLEGDAVFFAADDEKPPPEGLRDVVRRMFEDFHHHQAEIAFTNTCACAGCVCACKMGIKFVAHHGTFGEHEVHGLRELIGTDVVLVHRLLKNSIGLKEYAAFTAPLVERWGGLAVGLDRRHVESYEHIGTVELAVWDLGSLRAAAS